MEEKKKPYIIPGLGKLIVPKGFSPCPVCEGKSQFKTGGKCDNCGSIGYVK